MKALLTREFNGLGGVSLEDVEVPEPGVGEVRVKVSACGLNFADPVSYTHLTLPTKA